MTHPDDVSFLILEGARRGDLRAMEVFIRHYQKPVFAFLSRALGRGPHVEDLAQEVFLRTYRALPHFRLGRAKISTWIFQIAVRLMQDRARRAAPLLVSTSEESFPQLVSSSRNPETQCGERRTLSKVEALVAELPEEQRVCLVLSEFHEQTQEEIALAMSCSVGTVKSRIHRAKKFLRDEVRESNELIDSAGGESWRKF